MNISKLYKSRFPGEALQQDAAGHESRAGIWRELCRFFGRFISENAVIMEIGAGYCQFINNVSDKASKRIAIDLNPDTHKYAEAGVEVINGDCLSIREFGDSSIDIIFMSNFLEHLSSRDIILDLFTECNRILKSDGRMMLMHPNIRLVGGAYWDFFDHQIPLTEKSICEALEMADFTIEECVPGFMPYTTRSRLPQAPWLVRLYLNFPLLWRFFGKQSFIVGSKKQSRHFEE